MVYGITSVPPHSVHFRFCMAILPRVPACRPACASRCVGEGAGGDDESVSEAGGFERLARGQPDGPVSVRTFLSHSMQQSRCKVPVVLELHDLACLLVLFYGVSCSLAPHRLYSSLFSSLSAHLACKWGHCMSVVKYALSTPAPSSRRGGTGGAACIADRQWVHSVHLA